MADTLTAPRIRVVKRLFAVSGNNCAFPKCLESLVVGDKVTGKICHIRGDKAGSARYDATQSDEERHGFENLILMCGKHHDVIDDDEESYTVERLMRMKTEHERTASHIPDDEAERSATLLVQQAVFSVQQSGGITAHTVHVHNYPDAQEQNSAAPAKREVVTAQIGNGRFRAKDEAIGQYWNTIPGTKDPGLEIFLREGPIIWVRMRSSAGTEHDFDNDALLRCVQISNVPLQPLTWANLHYIRALDGVGTYATEDPRNASSESPSICFAFSHGEIWAADMMVLGYSGKKLYFVEIARTIAVKFRGYAEYLSCLGLPGPFEWSVGVDDVKNWTLEVPPATGHVNLFGGHRCLQKDVLANGVYNLGDSVPETLMPFFQRLFRACGTSVPAHIGQVIQSSGIR